MSIKHLLPKATLFGVTCVLCVSPGFSQNTPVKPDNSKVNQRDRNDGQLTADDQKMNAADRDLTAKIRKSITDDKSLSTYARNIKVIAQDGTVTLKGPVRTDAEAKDLVAKAVAAAGSADKVINQLSVAPEGK